MPPARREPYRLAPRARTDLEAIWRYSSQNWSIERADRYIDDLERVFEIIAAMPELARERREFTPPVRIHVHERHVIAYALSEDGVVILRVLGGRQDWASVLRETEG